MLGSKFAVINISMYAKPNTCCYDVPCQDIQNFFEGALVEQLEEDSGNIVQLITDAYEASIPGYNWG